MPYRSSRAYKSPWYPFGVTKYGLADRDVLRRFVRHVLRLWTEAMPAKALAFGDQPQFDCDWLDEVGVHVLPHNGCLLLRVGEAKNKVLILAVRSLLAALVRVVARASHIGTGALLALVLVRLTISPGEIPVQWKILLSSHLT